MTKMSMRGLGVTALALLVLALLCLYAALGRSLQYTTSVAILTSFPSDTGTELTDLRALYLQTVKLSVTGVLLQTPAFGVGGGQVAKLPQLPYNETARQRGLDWPQFGLTMAGVVRMDNILDLWTTVIKEGIEGDFLEAGTWRGGSSIFSRAVLKAFGVKDRKVHVVDSFLGLPPATTKEDAVYEGLTSVAWSTMDYLKVSQEQVADNFRRYDLLDNQVAFYKGYFRYALPEFRAGFQGKLAILRMDGDMWESTTDELFNLYGMLSVGGYVIVDDWGIYVCADAVKHFFKVHKQPLPKMHRIDEVAVYWRKTRHFKINYKWYKRWNTTRPLEATAKV